MPKTIVLQPHGKSHDGAFMYAAGESSFHIMLALSILLGVLEPAANGASRSSNEEASPGHDSVLLRLPTAVGGWKWSAVALQDMPVCVRPEQLSVPGSD